MEITYQEPLTTGWSKFYNPPPNSTLNFNSLEVAAEPFPNSSFKIAVYWDQDGDGKNLVPIHKLYTIKNSYKISLDSSQSFTAGPNSRIITRRHIFGAKGHRETFVSWNITVN